jgi:hypothetical protein
MSSVRHERVDTWMNSQTQNPHKFVPCFFLKHFTRIEFNHIPIKHDNGIETRIKEMHGPSTTNQYLSNLELRFPFTSLYLDEMFPTTAEQRKWIKELLITWYQEIDERGRYSVIMIEITSGAY